MASSAEFGEDFGAATGSPAKGTTRTIPASQGDWKNTGDVSTAYSSSPIQAGSNSYDKWQFVRWSGTFNQILNVKFSHSAGSFGTGLTLMGKVAPAGGYVAPSTTTNSNLTTDMTAVISASSGAAVQVGATGPEASGKASSSTSNPTYSEYLVTQLQTTTSAAPGDIGAKTLTIMWDEN